MAFFLNNNASGTKNDAFLQEVSQQGRVLHCAQRHSRLVAVLRLVLPILIVGLVSVYVVSFIFSTRAVDDINHGTFSTGFMDLVSARPTMRNPYYTGFDKKNGTEYTISADRAVTDLDESKPIELFGIEADLKQPTGIVFKLTSAEGKFYRKENYLELMKDIVVVTPDNMSARLSQASVFPKQGLILSNKPVKVGFSAGTLEGNTLRVEQNKNQFHLLDGVIMRFHPKTRIKDNTTNNLSPNLVGFSGQIDRPVDVKARNLLISANEQSVRFKGNIVARQGSTKLTAEIMDINYGAERGFNNTAQVKKITARNDVVITYGEKKITSQYAVFDTEEDIAELIGNVVILATDDVKISGDKALINNVNGKITLLGQVMAKQGNNVMRGTRLDYYQHHGKLSLTSPGSDDNRINVKFIRQTNNVLATNDGRESNANNSIDNKLISSQIFRSDPSEPINIEASSLDVSETIGRATFRKHVRIVQELFRIETSILHADYSGTLGLAPHNLASRSQQTVDIGYKTTELKSIFAPGKITISSKNGQYVSGETGKFDIKRNTIILTGGVVIRQKHQLLRGERLVIDLTSGLSRIETDIEDGWRSVILKTGKPKTAISKDINNPSIKTNTKDECSVGRMCAMFFPTEKMKIEPDRSPKD